MDPRTYQRSVEIHLHAHGEGRLKVQIWHWDQQIKKIRFREYRQPSWRSFQRLSRALCLGTTFDRPSNIEVEAGSGSIQHLSVDVLVKGPLT